jgi:hypothetical protein
VSADSLADAIRSLSQQLAEELRGGNALVSDARALEPVILEAEGWLQTARRFLDPADPLGRADTDV